MFADAFAEIEDSTEDLFDFDLPELREEEEPTDDETWNAFLNSKWDF